MDTNNGITFNTDDDDDRAAAIDAAIEAADLRVSTAYDAAIAAREAHRAALATFRPEWMRPDPSTFRAFAADRAEWKAKVDAALQAEMDAWAEHDDALEARRVAYCGR